MSQPQQVIYVDVHGTAEFIIVEVTQGPLTVFGCPLVCEKDAVPCVSVLFFHHHDMKEVLVLVHAAV